LISRSGEAASQVELDEAIEGHPLREEELRLLDAYWRAANYLSVGQVYSRTRFYTSL
jgi:xylulose-5-phosphate/fructose-6-phosphate phosphoketolase